MAHRHTTVHDHGMTMLNCVRPYVLAQLYNKHVVCIVLCPQWQKLPVDTGSWLEAKMIAWIVAISPLYKWKGEGMFA